MANSLNTITVDGVVYDAEQYAKDHPTVKANDELGKDAFLQLLVAQMKYQDPLDPQDNSEYVAELANFSSLEQMTNVNTKLEELATVINNIDTSVLVGQLSGMIGKAVNWTNTTTTPGSDGNSVTTTTTLAGMIKGITMSETANPMVIAEADGRTYKVAISDIINVFEVYDDPEAENQNSSEIEETSNTYTTAAQTSTNKSSQSTTTTSSTKTSSTKGNPTLMGAFTNASSSFSAPSDTATQKSGPTINGPFTYAI